MVGARSMGLIGNTALARSVMRAATVSATSGPASPMYPASSALVYTGHSRHEWPIMDIVRVPAFHTHTSQRKISPSAPCMQSR